MKKEIVFFVALLSLIGCQKEQTIKEPKKLIDKATMISILYDLELLEASKYQRMSKTGYERVIAKEFIFKKYKIDSAQFAQSNIYYASFTEDYKAIFEQVAKRLQTNSNKIDSLIKRKQKLKKTRPKPDVTVDLKKQNQQ